MEANMTGRGHSLPKQWIAYLALAAMLVVQLTHFTAGYRLTADDAMSLQFFWRGWEHIWDNAYALATYSGRIGQLFMVPLNALGAYWAESQAGRLIMVGCYFTILFIFSAHMSQVLARNNRDLTLLLSLCLLALHPLAYEHMPPTAYPLQNTLPFLIALLARWGLWRYPSMATSGKLTLHLLLGIAMLTSEYVILLATALMAIEHSSYAAFPKEGPQGSRLLGLTYRPTILAADTVTTVLVMAAYLGFRAYYPSDYVGNRPDGLLDLSGFLTTAFLHVVSGTALRHWNQFRFDQLLDPATLALFLTVTVLCFLSARQLFVNVPILRRKQSLMVAMISVVFMLYMTAPLAATARQQIWCLEGGMCGYLDSRSAYLGSGLLVWAAFMLVAGGKGPWARTTALAFSLLLALMAGTNYVANQNVAEQMADQMTPWDRARGLACNSATPGLIKPNQIEGIDPHQQIKMHGYNMDRRLYWLEYMNHLRTDGWCDDKAVRTKPLFDPFYLSFSPYSYKKWLEQANVVPPVLGPGWSHVEHWGVWSDGVTSRLNFDLSNPVLGEVTHLALDFNLYTGPSVSQQRIVVSINSQDTQTWIFKGQEMKQGLVRTLDIRDFIGERSVTVTLEYHNPRSPAHPGESADPRQLALGLKSIELMEQPQSEKPST
jgi:hypothetical protein